MTIAAGLMVARFVHYLALSTLFGGALFPRYGFAQPKSDLGAPLIWLRPLIFGAACITLVSGIAWFGIVNATVPNAEFDAWIFRLLLAIALVGLLFAKQVTGWRFYAVLFGSLVLMATLALTGHAGSEESPAAPIHRILDVFHLIAAGAWVGALIVFACWVIAAIRRAQRSDLQILERSLARFSVIGTMAVVTLSLSGILSPGFLSSFRTVYGQVLLAKLGVFIAMVMLAAANRYWLTPRLLKALESSAPSSSATGPLALSILTETTLAIVVLALVGWLGILTPVLR
jgi:putative copper resistance protein D